MFAEPDAPDVASVYLFGSVRENRAHRDSDIDLAEPVERFLEIAAAIEAEKD